MKNNDLKTMRKNAAENLEDGAITEGYRPDVDHVLKMLDSALATELVCMLRYRRHYYAAHSIRAKAIADEFLEHANQEQEHMFKIAERINQLGGEPDLNPETAIRRSHAEYDEHTELIDMIRSDLVAERIAIDSYRKNIIELGNEDSTTRRLFEEILAQEEEHAHEFAGLLENMGGKEKGGEKSRGRSARDVGASDAARGGAEGRRHQTARGEGPAVKSNLHQVVEVANELVTDEIKEDDGREYIPKE
jgi:bacterioferritin